MKQRDLKEAKTSFNTTNSTIYLEEYLEENLLKSKALLEFEAVKETRQERIPAMVILGIDRDALSTRGLNKAAQDALYRSLFVYSHGVHNIINEYSKYTTDTKLPGKLWNALLYLVDSCDPGNTELISSEIKELYTEKINSFMDFHQKFVEIEELQIGKLALSENISKIKYLEIVNSTHLDNIALESIQVRQRQQIETTKTLLESASKSRDEMKDLYMEAQMKLFERDKEIDFLTRKNADLTYTVRDLTDQNGSLKMAIDSQTAKMKESDEKMSVINEEKIKMMLVVQESKEVQGRCQYQLDNFDAERDYLKSQIRAYEHAKKLLVIDRKKSIKLLTDSFQIIRSLSESLGQFQNTVGSCTTQFNSFLSLKKSSIESNKVNLVDAIDENVKLRLAQGNNPEFSFASVVTNGGKNVESAMAELLKLSKDTDGFLNLVITPPRPISKKEREDRIERLERERLERERERQKDPNNKSAFSENASAEEVNDGNSPEIEEAMRPLLDVMESSKYQALAAELELFTENLILNISDSQEGKKSLLADLQINCSDFTATDYLELLQEKRESDIQLSLADALQNTYLDLLDRYKFRLEVSERKGTELQDSLNEKNFVLRNLFEDLRLANEIVEQYHILKGLDELHVEEINDLKQKVAELEVVKLSNEAIISNNNKELKQNSDKIDQDSQIIFILRKELASMTEMFTRKSKFEDMYNDITYKWHTIMDVMMQVLKLSKKSWKKFFDSMDAKAAVQGASKYSGDMSVDKPFLSYKGTEIYELLGQTNMSEEEKHCILDLSNLSNKSIEFIGSFDELSEKFLRQKELCNVATSDMAKLKLYYAQDKIKHHKMHDTINKQTRELNEFKERIKDLEEESLEMRNLASKYSSEVASLNKKIKLVQQRNVMVKEEGGEKKAHDAVEKAQHSRPTIDKDIVKSVINSISQSNKTAMSIITNRLKQLQDRLDSLGEKVDTIDLDEAIKNSSTRLYGRGDSIFDDQDEGELEIGEGGDRFDDGDVAVDSIKRDGDSKQSFRRDFTLSINNNGGVAQNQIRSLAEKKKKTKDASNDIFAPSNLLDASVSITSDDAEEKMSSRESSIVLKENSIEIGDAKKDKKSSEDKEPAAPQKGMVSTFVGDSDRKEAPPERFLGMLVKIKKDNDNDDLKKSSPAAVAPEIASSLDHVAKAVVAMEGPSVGGGSKLKNLVRKNVLSPNRKRDEEKDSGHIGVSHLGKFDANNDMVVKANKIPIESGLHTFTISNSSVSKAPVGKAFTNVVFDDEIMHADAAQQPTRPVGRPQNRSTTVGKIIVQTTSASKEKDVPVEIKVAGGNVGGGSKDSIHKVPQAISEMFDSESDEEEKNVSTKGDIQSSTLKVEDVRSNDKNDSISNSVAATAEVVAAPPVEVHVESSNDDADRNERSDTLADVIVSLVAKARASKVADPKAWRDKKSSFLETRGDKYESEIKTVEANRSSDAGGENENSNQQPRQLASIRKVLKSGGSLKDKLAMLGKKSETPIVEGTSDTTEG